HNAAGLDDDAHAPPRKRRPRGKPPSAGTTSTQSSGLPKFDRSEQRRALLPRDARLIESQDYPARSPRSPTGAAPGMRLLDLPPTLPPNGRKPWGTKEQRGARGCHI